ncbi:hypothetical protein RMATCC62417_13234 [Rhizopus microsporus]|nr:hypothetical protein RMATCC62417_13234 [Rhizopus microsporus]
MTPLPICADLLIGYARTTFNKAYLVVFAALALEILAMSNAITLICTSFGADEESERLGSAYTITDEQKKYYAGSPGAGPYNAYSADTMHSPARSNGYDAYGHQDANAYQAGITSDMVEDMYSAAHEAIRENPLPEKKEAKKPVKTGPQFNKRVRLTRKERLAKVKAAKAAFAAEQ